jgi:hypothetical protein
VVERGPDGTVHADDGPTLLEVRGDGLVTSFAVNTLSGNNGFSLLSLLDYSAIRPGGTVYGDDLGGPGSGFSPFQQMVAMAHGHTAVLWQGRTAPGR